MNTGRTTLWLSVARGMLARGVRSDAWAGLRPARWLRVAVGVSGGVDSSVAALLLQRHVRERRLLHTAFPGCPRAPRGHARATPPPCLSLAAMPCRGTM